MMTRTSSTNNYKSKREALSLAEQHLSFCSLEVASSTLLRKGTGYAPHRTNLPANYYHYILTDFGSKLHFVTLGYPWVPRIDNVVYTKRIFKSYVEYPT